MFDKKSSFTGYHRLLGLVTKVGYRLPLVATLGYQVWLPVTTDYHLRLLSLGTGYHWLPLSVTEPEHWLPKFVISAGNRTCRPLGGVFFLHSQQPGLNITLFCKLLFLLLNISKIILQKSQLLNRLQNFITIEYQYFLLFTIDLQLISDHN